MMYFPEQPYAASEYIKTSTGNIVSRASTICKPQAVELPGGRCIVSKDVVIRGDLAAIQINKYSCIGEGTTLRPCALMQGEADLRFVPMTIGSHTRIGANCTIEAAVVGMGCVIGDGAVLGPRSVLKDFVTVRDGGVVPPDAVVAPFSIIEGATGAVVGEAPESTSTLAVSDAVRIYKSWRPVTVQAALLPLLLVVLALAQLPVAAHAQCMGCCDTGGGRSLIGLSIFVVLAWTTLRSLKFQSVILQNCVTTALVLLAALSLLCMFLLSSKSAQMLLFAKLCGQLSNHNSLDKRRCELLSQVRGRVLEIGPGPGVNIFKCLDPLRIEALHLVEPNAFFRPEIDAALRARNFTMPVFHHEREVEQLSLNADALPTFDYILGTHVLCSVSSVEKTLLFAEKYLVSGGKYLLLEHVQASPSSARFTYLFQVLLQPLFFIVGNGCTFRALKEELAWLNAGGKWSFDLHEWDAPLPLPILRPHLIGTLTKK